MAEKTEGSITIEADPARVMAVITDFEAYPEWSSEFNKVEVRDPGTEGRARDVYYEVAAGPLNAKYVLRYAYDGDGRVSWESVECAGGIRSIEGAYELEPDGAGTKVTYRTAVELAIPLPGFMKRQGEKRVIDTALKGLKKRVESLGSAG